MATTLDTVTRRAIGIAIHFYSAMLIEEDLDLEVDEAKLLRHALIVAQNVVERALEGVKS